MKTKELIKALQQTTEGLVEYRDKFNSLDIADKTGITIGYITLYQVLSSFTISFKGKNPSLKINKYAGEDVEEIVGMIRSLTHADSGKT